MNTSFYSHNTSVTLQGKKTKQKNKKSLDAPMSQGGILWLKLFGFLRLNTPVVNMRYKWESCGVAIMQLSRSQVHIDFFR